MKFSERLLNLRETKGILQKDIAKSIHVNLHTYQNFEHGTRLPRMEVLIAIADFYGMSLDDLVERTPSDQAPPAATPSARSPRSKTKNRSDGGAIQVKYLVEGLPELQYVGGKSDWIDLCCGEDVALRAGEFRLIPLGIAVALPEGYEAHIVPRSSTFTNYGILQTNSMGVVDFSYRGDGDEWKLPAYATRDVSIPKGARICQFRIAEHQPKLRFVAVDHLDGPDRGGFGSTGH